MLEYDTLAIGFSLSLSYDKAELLFATFVIRVGLHLPKVQLLRDTETHEASIRERVQIPNLPAFDLVTDLFP